MDSNDKFWLRLWQTITAGIVALAAVIGSCTMHSNYLTTQAIQKGSDPIKVHCALSSAPDRALCTLAATH